MNSRNSYPNGLYYYEDIMKDDEANEIIKDIDNNEYMPLSSSSNSRLVQHYGFLYDYKMYKINTPTKPFTPTLIKLRDILTSFCRENNIITDDYIFNQCIINNYYCGQGISKHIDLKTFGAVIGCFSFNSGATIIFKKYDAEVSLYIKPNSLYVMSGDARYIWTHEMPAIKNDRVNGEIIPRKRRLSVTFRNVPQGFASNF